MAIKNSVSNDFCSTFVDSINVFDCHLSSVYLDQYGITKMDRYTAKRHTKTMLFNACYQGRNQLSHAVHPGADLI